MKLQINNMITTRELTNTSNTTMDMIRHTLRTMTTLDNSTQTQNQLGIKIRLQDRPSGSQSLKSPMILTLTSQTSFTRIRKVKRKRVQNPSQKRLRN